MERYFRYAFILRISQHLTKAYEASEMSGVRTMEILDMSLIKFFVQRFEKPSMSMKLNEPDIRNQTELIENTGQNLRNNS